MCFDWFLKKTAPNQLCKPLIGLWKPLIWFSIHSNSRPYSRSRSTVQGVSNAATILHGANYQKVVLCMPKPLISASLIRAATILVSCRASRAYRRSYVHWQENVAKLISAGTYSLTIMRASPDALKEAMNVTICLRVRPFPSA